jgi:hypothetical protein
MIFAPFNLVHSFSESFPVKKVDCFTPSLFTETFFSLSNGLPASHLLLALFLTFSFAKDATFCLIIMLGIFFVK